MKLSIFFIILSFCKIGMLCDVFEEEDLDVMIEELLKEIQPLPSSPHIDWDNENSKPKEERPLFHCPHCTRSFVRREYIERHIRNIHERIKPFFCKICNGNYSRKDNTRQHVRNKHKSLIETKCLNMSRAEENNFIDTECIYEVF